MIQLMYPGIKDIHLHQLKSQNCLRCISSLALIATSFMAERGRCLQDKDKTWDVRRSGTERAPEESRAETRACRRRWERDPSLFPLLLKCPAARRPPRHAPGKPFRSRPRRAAISRRRRHRLPARGPWNRVTSCVPVCQGGKP
jgi:hypothetical protein